jgi:hypothetical protein
MASNPKPKPPLEKEVQKNIIKYLNSLNIGKVLRHNTGSFNTGSRFIKCGEKGTADLSVELHDSTMTIWIECKREGGKPTPEQLEFIERQIKRGNIAFIAHSVEEVRTQLLKYYKVK